MVGPMRPWMKTGLDLVLVLVFAIIGRASHGEALTPVGILVTGWPFLVAGASDRCWRVSSCASAG